MNKRAAQTFTPTTGAAIHMREIVKKYQTVAGEVTVLKGINTSFLPGEFVSVVGKSGSGKSTLVNMVTGIDRPTSGVVEIGGTQVQRLNESEMSRWRGKNLGIVFQFYQLLPVLSLLENTMLPMDIAGVIPPVEREQRAMDLLKMVGVADVAHKTPDAVSGGQQQAAAVGRALANDPPFIVADEPTGNLDSRTAENIFQIFEQLADQGRTVIVVTHDPQLAERAQRTVLLCDGEIIHPAVKQCLPWLTHPQMLRLTKHSRVLPFAPQERIITAGQPVDNLYLLSKGSVEVSGSKTTSILKPGQFFGQMALLSNKPAHADVTAAEPDGAELLAVNADIVCELIGQSNTTRTSLLQAQEVWL
jgi:putative ABC transport system ATP-binding protein